MTGRSNALLGTQAQYEHSPPTSSRSTTATRRPRGPGAIGGILSDRSGAEHHDVVGLF